MIKKISLSPLPYAIIVGVLCGLAVTVMDNVIPDFAYKRIVSAIGTGIIVVVIMKLFFTKETKK